MRLIEEQLDRLYLENVRRKYVSDRWRAVMLWVWTIR